MADQQADESKSMPPFTDKGSAIFLDIFRRADKNDDGFISWEEFAAYCADGVMGKEDLKNLFNEIDSKNTNNIDTEELCTYFAQHLGQFKDMFALLEVFNHKMTEMLYATSKKYKESPRTDKFITRFMLREVLQQMACLTKPMEGAQEILDAQAREESVGINPVEPCDVVDKPVSSVVPGRVARRTKRQVSAPPLVEAGYGSTSAAMNSQVDRLAKLLDRVERKVNFDGFRDEEVVQGEDNTLTLVQREFSVGQEQLDDFKGLLRAYVDVTQGFRGCLNVSVRELRDSNLFSVYEIWTSEDKHLSNNDAEEFKKLLEFATETNNMMKIPDSWWKREI